MIAWIGWEYQEERRTPRASTRGSGVVSPDPIERRYGAAALLCTDDRFLKAEGLSLAIFKGCVPVDGDTYDVPLQVATAAARYKSLGQPAPKMGYPEKFGSPDRQRDLSAVRHIAMPLSSSASATS